MGCFTRDCIIGTLLLWAGGAFALAQDLSNARSAYSDAVVAIDRGDWTEYRQLRLGLEDYPLAIYLDYFQLTRQVHRIRPEEASRFILRSEDSPLPVRFLSAYLRRAGKDRRWDDFLAVKPDEPNSIDLKCYYFRAQLAAGNRESAFDGARRLWVHGESRPDECDPLFDAWQATGGLTDDIVWARLLAAFDARQRSLMRYVARKGSAELRPWSDALQAVYAAPAALRQQRLPTDSPYSADIASRGLVEMARYQPERALDDWEFYRKRLSFSQQQARDVEYAIALRSLFAKTQAHAPWLQDVLVRLADDKLVEIRLRWTLAEQDWDAMGLALPLLSDAGREDSTWRYWQAMLHERDGKQELAKQLLEGLAAERGYYSFLAAERIGRPYAFNNQPLTALDPGALQGMPAVRRIDELRFHEKQNLAHSEWYKVLEDAPDAQRKQELALLASNRGWHRMAIDAAARAEAWDALEVRFPTPYSGIFKQHASAWRVPSTELMAIARRESAFYPQARSPVGARGLMQIMPATGEQVASSLGTPHARSDLYQVEHNVLLGSAYYRQLLDRFDGNRVFALTAYNAGPHRVNRWRNKPGEGLPVEVWIETIPFRETRNYVKAVLSYNVVFQYLMGDTYTLLTPEERRASY